MHSPSLTTTKPRMQTGTTVRLRLNGRLRRPPRYVATLQRGAPISYGYHVPEYGSCTLPHQTDTFGTFPAAPVLLWTKHRPLPTNCSRLTSLRRPSHSIHRLNVMLDTLRRSEPHTHVQEQEITGRLSICVAASSPTGKLYLLSYLL